VDGSFQQNAIAKATHVARIPKRAPLDVIAPIVRSGITVSMIPDNTYDPPKLTLVGM